MRLSLNCMLMLSMALWGCDAKKQAPEPSRNTQNTPAMTPRQAAPAMSSASPRPPRVSVTKSTKKVTQVTRPLPHIPKAVTRPPCPAQITPEQLKELSASPLGRVCLRKRLIKGKYLTKAILKLKGLQLSHLFGKAPVYVNGQRYVYREKKGRHHRQKRPRLRETLFVGDRVSPFGKRDDLGFTFDDVRLIRSFYAFRILQRDDNVFNRTFPGRFKDHQELLEGIIHNPVTPELKRLHAILHPKNNQRTIFFDIGPGIANIDLKEMNGKGVPAVTSLEMAKQFPQMPVVLLDLPLQVHIFMGKTTGRTRKKERFTISEEKRSLLLSQRNIHILSGNGLLSLKAQYANPKKNPLKNRPRPELTPNTTVYVRAVNSIDIYCMYHKKNGTNPTLRVTMMRMAKDFKKNPVLFMFNRILLLKRPGEVTWTIIGHVSKMGFDHNERELSRGGEPPFTFNLAFYHYFM